MGTGGLGEGYLTLNIEIRHHYSDMLLDFMVSAMMYRVDGESLFIDLAKSLTITE